MIGGRSIFYVSASRSSFSVIKQPVLEQIGIIDRLRKIARLINDEITISSDSRRISIDIEEIERGFFVTIANNIFLDKRAPPLHFISNLYSKRYEILETNYSKILSSRDERRYAISSRKLKFCDREEHHHPEIVVPSCPRSRDFRTPIFRPLDKFIQTTRRTRSISVKKMK